MFVTVEQAQAAVHAFVAEYNYDRPHQASTTPSPQTRFHRPTAVRGCGRAAGTVATGH
ncbi:hypothetical protein ACVCAH_37010 [Micromonospora sp. LZ34]